VLQEDKKRPWSTEREGAEEFRSTGGVPETPPRTFDCSMKRASCVLGLSSYVGNRRSRPKGQGRKGSLWIG
jgi:hypothetical protein